MNSTTFTGGTGSLTLTDFNITLNTTMQEDKYRYQTSSTILNNNFESKDCSFQYTTIWDNTSDASIVSNLGSLVPTYTLTLNNDSKHWAFAINGKLEDYTKPDPDKGTYEQQVTINTYYSGSTAGVTVTVT
jgi:hypothetical protein